MALQKIIGFLARFEGLMPPDEAIKKQVMNWCRVRFSTHKELDPNQVSVLEGLTIELRYPNLVITSSNAVLKNSIFLTRNKLLQDLRQKFGSHAPTQIFFK